MRWPRVSCLLGSVGGLDGGNQRVRALSFADEVKAARGADDEEEGDLPPANKTKRRIVPKRRS